MKAEDVIGWLTRRMGTRFSWIALIMATVVFGAGCGRRGVEHAEPPSLSVETLLARMTDIPALARRPWGKSFLVSSYDRTGGNRDWWTWTHAMLNRDGRVTLLDVEGAGYISRIWIASFSAERWLFFFDHEPEPRLALTHDELFGGGLPFVMPLAGRSGGGRYSMLPIPFAKAMRIEIEPEQPLQRDARNYFQINYTLTPDAPRVASWPLDLTASLSNAVTEAVAALDANRDEMASQARGLLADAATQDLAPGGRLRILDARGAGSVAGLAIRLDRPDEAEALRHELPRRLRLQMRWDGRRHPSVDVPLGDFFCNAFYFRRFVSRLVGRVDDVFISRIPMPYRRRATIEIVNESDVPVRLTTATEVGAADPRGRYFHADWRATTRSGERFLMGAYTGSGHYLGCYLTAIGQDGSWNILEGDEWIQPDAGIQPLQHGTGLEDYFSGAYYYDSLFDLPFHGLTEKGAMRTDQYRFHPLDAVDFDHDFRMDIEFGDQNRSQGYKSSVVYWYGDAAQDSRIEPAAQELRARPADRFELAGWMAKLFLLERAGLWHDAGVRCRYLAERHANQPWADLLRLRSVAYRERLEGIDAVRAEYETLHSSSFPPAAMQAAELLWFHEHEQNALLGLHMRGSYKLWLNGQEVSEGSSHAVLEVRRLRLPPGDHTWEVEFEPTMQGSFISFCLRTHWGDITSAGEWEPVDVEPQPGRDVTEQFSGASVLPNMTVWQFEPNAHVGMQSGAQTVSLWAFWDGLPRVKRIRLRRTWNHGPAETVAEEPAVAVPERTAEELRAHAID